MAYISALSGLEATLCNYYNYQELIAYGSCLLSLMAVDIL